jgi:ABC-type bacteriocin/lantibiotic exporter with double-glycine peptidase domain
MIPTLLLLLAVAIALGLLSPKYIWVFVSWLLLGPLLFGIATHAYQSFTEGGVSLEELLLTTIFVVMGGLFLLKITLPEPVWRKLWHDAIERGVRSGLSLIGQGIARLLRGFIN